MDTWRPDVLGPGFECLDIDLGADDEGPVVATLVRHLAPRETWWRRLLRRRRLLHGTDVLYVHGWSDYFFQRRLARYWADHGADFYALDLRKYGRSLRPGQTAGYISNLEEYDEEIERTLRIMRKEDPDTTAVMNAVDDAGSESGISPPSSRRPLILVGHSTGGLVLSLWASRHPGVADALVLNSPWLEFQLSRMGRQVLAPLVDLRARFHTKELSSALDLGFYARAQREVRDEDDTDDDSADDFAADSADVNLEWRPERSHAISAGWLRAVLHGHELIDRGVDVGAPVCVLLSERSAAPLRWHESLTRADTVLDVDEVAKAALDLGPSVTIERIDGALHDVFLSRRAAREEAYRRMDRWVRGWALWWRATGGGPGDHSSAR